MEFLKDVGNFFTNIWTAYIDFMTNIFGYNIAIGITIVLGFIILSLLFLWIIRSANNK